MIREALNDLLKQHHNYLLMVFLVTNCNGSVSQIR